MGRRFVAEPNLPRGTVKSIFLGDKYIRELKNGLEGLGISIISVPKNGSVPEPVSYHADMSLCYMGSGILVAASAIYDELRQNAPEELNILKAESRQSADYPNDIGLNACLIGDRLLHKLENTDKSVLTLARKSRLRSYNVNQGYTKCSVCILTRNRIITGDLGIHRQCGELGVQSLLIENAPIRLDGYDTGFIGGCCGKISRDKVAFTGLLKGLRDERRIMNFIWDTGMEAVFLTDKPVFDVGSIIPVEEYP